MNYKNSKDAAHIISLQNEDGTWGQMFHSLSLPNKKNELTTEQALRRLMILGFTIDDAPVRKAVDCMTACLRGERKIDSYWEKTHNWDLFTQLMLSTWIKIFEPDNAPALQFAKRWAKVIDAAFETGIYNHGAYMDAYIHEFGSKPRGSRELDFADFYHIHLLQGVLSLETENILLNYLIAKETGIYYVYSKPINKLPDIFESRDTSWYLAAVEILSGYQCAKEKLGFVIDWLERNRDSNGGWDLGTKAKDNIYLPLSDSWRSKTHRKADCTYRVSSILEKLM